MKPASNAAVQRDRNTIQLLLVTTFTSELSFLLSDCFIVQTTRITFFLGSTERILTLGVDARNLNVIWKFRGMEVLYFLLALRKEAL